MKKLIQLLEESWNIYGGVLLSTAVSWLFDFSRASMDKGTSYLIFTLACISFLTFLKKTVFKKKTTKVDDLIMKQKSIKAMDTAIEPEQHGEAMYKTIVKTTKLSRKVGKEMKNTFKKFGQWLKANVGAVTATLTFIASLCIEYSNILPTFTVKGREISFASIGYVISIVIAVLTYGFTSAKTQATINLALKKTIDEDASDGHLSAQGIKQTKLYIKNLNKQIRGLETDLIGAKEEYSNFLIYAQNGLKTQTDVGQALSKVNDLEGKINSIKLEVEKYQKLID